MVCSYITTGLKHKMKAPNKGRAVHGSMDGCPNDTLAWQPRPHPYKKLPCWSNETQISAKDRGDVRSYCWCSCERVWRSRCSGYTKALLHRSMFAVYTAHKLLSTGPHNNCYSGISHRLWMWTTYRVQMYKNNYNKMFQELKFILRALNTRHMSAECDYRISDCPTGEVDN